MRNTHPMGPALKSKEPVTLAYQVGKFLGHGRHAAALALTVEVPVETARSWARGLRRMLAYRARLLAARLISHAAVARSLAADVEYYASVLERQPRHLRGFCKMRDRDGSGVPRDGRWRGGRPKRPFKPGD